ncbi:MAG: IS1380 family transposase, partial [Lentisphaerae bacterium]|nr:IS1380 family transposase [Lentisphaerota bacterium]
MTNCNALSGIFQGSKGRKFDVNFSGGHISSDGGLLLLAELDKRVGITAGISKILKSFDTRQAGKITHST